MSKAKNVAKSAVGLALSVFSRKKDLDLAAGLLFSIRDGTADCLIQHAGIIPSLFEITVILRYAGGGDVTALTAAVFSDERNNFARTEINGCNRCFHRFL